MQDREGQIHVLQGILESENNETPAPLPRSSSAAQHHSGKNPCTAGAFELVHAPSSMVEACKRRGRHSLIGERSIDNLRTRSEYLVYEMKWRLIRNELF